MSEAARQVSAPLIDAVDRCSHPSVRTVHLRKSVEAEATHTVRDGDAGDGGKTTGANEKAHRNLKGDETSRARMTTLA